MTKYRILKKYTGDKNYPFEFHAQVKGIFGWRDIRAGSWSYSITVAEDYIITAENDRIKPTLPPDEIVKEIEYETPAKP